MSEKKIIVEMSARHVHVTERDLETLFGKGASLTPKRELSQPGQYLCEERVDLIGPKKTIANVSILGPTVRKLRWRYRLPMRERLVLRRLYV